MYLLRIAVTFGSSFEPNNPTEPKLGYALRVVQSENNHEKKSWTLKSSWDGTESEAGLWHFLLFLCFFEGQSMTGHILSFLFFRKYFLLVNNLNLEVHASTSYLRVHSLSGDSPTALKYPSRQGHTDNPCCVLLLLAGQGRQVTFMDRYVPESQPLVGRSGEGR